MNRRKSLRDRMFGVGVVVGLGLLLAGVGDHGGASAPGVGLTSEARAAMPNQLLQDAFDGGVAWFNTSGPIRLRDLRGKIVILDFWTYCCINCHHVLPELARLEKKYPNELVVLGVHTPKFLAEQDSENIRQKIREYRIEHPVVSDANMIIWNRFGVNSWPTIVVIDVDGQPVGSISGEGHYALLDRVVGQLAEKARAAKTLNETPVKFFPENEKPYDTPLLYPGKVLADAASRRLFVSDTGHNRIVSTDLEGHSPIIIGSGATGFTDGPFEKAEFNRPQGTCLIGDMLYVADTENHAIRAVDLKSRVVSTIAGTGQQGTREHRHGPGKTMALNSPWDLAHVPGSRSLYIAMAGPHQIWKYDLESHEVGVFAGSGIENITDGTPESAAFAQPSGLATDGAHLYVADSEVSGIRTISLLPNKHNVGRIVGEGLFEFGDVDGRGTAVRLQHCLGVAWGDGRLFIADTYNNKIKECDPRTRTVKSFVGDRKAGDTDQPPTFYQPGGLSVAGGKLYVADTNNHKIKVVDLASRAVSTLAIRPEAPKPPARRPVFLNAKTFDAEPARVKTGSELVLDVTLPIDDDFKLNEEGAMPYLVESTTSGVIAPSYPATGGRLSPPVGHFTLKVPLGGGANAGGRTELKVSVSAFVCNKGSNLCMIKSYVWKVPVTFASDGAGRVSLK